MKVDQFYAHTSSENKTINHDKVGWQLLHEHLAGVAKLAHKYATNELKEAAQWAGFLHDLGKYRDEFQEYLSGTREGSIETHHAVYGAAMAFQKGWLGPAFAIAGHHAGLHDLDELQSLVKGNTYDATNRLQSLKERFGSELKPIPCILDEPSFAQSDDLCVTELYIRMLFSSLVDADFIDTESFYTGKLRENLELDTGRLLDRLEKFREGFNNTSVLNGYRNDVYKECQEASTRKQGYFSLLVPTGGGKTLSSMAFALAHARQHSLRRIIVVIPYLSIIEQNAAEYRKVLDPDDEGVVLEHHSSTENNNDDGEDKRSQEELAAENWDAPVVVTTSVQFIESLFSNRPSKCRKLHNISNSVVILDEVQTLPPHLLNPLLHIIRDLKEHYGVSFLFSTATYPAFVRSNSLNHGFEPYEVNGIVSRPIELFKILKRVNYEIRSDKEDWESLAKEWSSEEQCLAVVNTRKQAAVFWEMLRNCKLEGVLHLSSAMCAEHRSEVLVQARTALKEGNPCRLVSTQVVEAGVDIDFPVVYRALGPMDSIVQAAGRCNREGKLQDKGRVVVFRPKDGKLPSGVYSTATDITASLLKEISLEELGSDPGLFARYFGELFQYVPTDHNVERESTIQEDREKLRFREVARKAKVIKDQTQGVIARWGKGIQIVERIRSRDCSASTRFNREDLRSLQRFMVNLHQRDFRRLESLGLLRTLLPNMELKVLDDAAYHRHLGVVIDQRPSEDFLL